MTIWRVNHSVLTNVKYTYAEADYVTVVYDKYNGTTRVEFRNRKSFGRSNLVDYVPLALVGSISIVEKVGV